MKQIIYVDILICVNLFINYFILIAVTKFLFLKIHKWRLFLGALLGAAYSLYILIPEPIWIISLLIKLLMSVTIILVAFGFHKILELFKIVLCFFGINFGFSGVMFALWCTLKPMGLIVKNGVVYFSLSPILLISSTVVSYLIIEFINKIVGKQQERELFYEIFVEIFSHTLKLKAKLDTGNTLKEPFSGIPVIVVKKEKIKHIIPENFLEIMNTFEIENYSNSLNLLKTIRLIPFKTIHGSGVLPAFKTDKIIINKQNLTKEGYLAVCSKDILEKNYDALIGIELIS